jgi:hypothetical protein
VIQPNFWEKYDRPYTEEELRVVCLECWEEFGSHWGIHCPPSGEQIAVGDLKPRGSLFRVGLVLMGTKFLTNVHEVETLVGTDE